jgi:outer membrane protein assembly factor BamB
MRHVIFAIGLNAFLLFSWLKADDWPNWRGPNRSGVSNENQWIDQWPADGPSIRWRAEVGTGFSSIVVANGRVFTLGNQDDIDTLCCFSATDGQVLWKYAYPAPLDDRYFEGGPTSTPTIDGDSVYMLSRAGELASLNLHDGAIRWSKNLVEEAAVEVPGWGFSSSPVIDGEHLYLGVGQSGMRLDKTTGEILWQSEGEAGYMTPLMIEFAGRQMLIVASGKFYQAVDPESGEVLWRKRWLTNFGCNAADPIFSDGKLFISSGYNRGSALLELTDDEPTVVWETKDFQNQWSSSILINNCLFGVDGDDTGDRFFKCIDFSKGEVLWSEVGLGSASVIAADGKLIILSDSGELIITPADRTKFAPTARASILSGKCWTTPVLSDGLLYARDASGSLICLDLRKR